MSAERFQDILSFVESLELSDNEYLNIANALRKVYENINSDYKWTTYDTNDIKMTFSNCLNNVVVNSYVKSISVSNLFEEYPAKFKFKIFSEIEYLSRNKYVRKEYEIQPSENKMGRLSILLEQLKPTTITMKFEELDFTYEYEEVLKELRARIDKEVKINYGNADDYDKDVDVNYETFSYTAIQMFINSCCNWFWDKHYKDELV